MLKDLTIDDYLKGREAKDPIDITAMYNAFEMIDKTNDLLAKFGEERAITSGYRPERINRFIPGAKPDSKHITCQAIDLEDKDGKLAEFCLKNLNILEDLGLWMEHPIDSVDHVHLQIVPPESHNRVFRA